MDAYGKLLEGMLKVEALPDFDNTEPAEEDTVNWRDEAKYYEQQCMFQMDKYSELAAALGVEGNAWFGDPVMGHDDLVAFAKDIREKAYMYDGLCD